MSRPRPPGRRGPAGARAGRPARQGRGAGKARPVVVAAAVIERAGRFLLTRRQTGVHLAGYWEFPGGKCRSAETRERCLQRELIEELGVDVRILRRLLTVSHSYPDRTIELHFFRCEPMDSPRPRLGQEMRWVSRDELPTLALPPADAELIELLVPRRHEGHEGREGELETRNSKPDTSASVPGTTKARRTRRARKRT